MADSTLTQLVSPADKHTVLIINMSLMALALGAPWFTDSVWPNHLLTKWLVAGLASAVLLTLTVWRLPYRASFDLHISWIKSSFLLLFVLGAISWLWSINTDYSISKWLLWCIGFGTFISAYHIQVNHDTLVRIGWGLLGCAGIISLIGVLQYLWGILPLDQYAPPASTFGNKNIATHAIVLAWPASLYLLTTRQITIIQTWLVTSTLAIIMAYIAFTQTRSSWVAITVQTLLCAAFLYAYKHHFTRYIFWNRHKTIAAWVSFGVFLLLINASPLGWSFFFSSALERLSDSTTAFTRLEIWAMNVAMILDNPIFGSGLGTWYQNEIQEGYAHTSGMSFLRAHNDLLELATELGLVGVALLLSGAIAVTMAVLTILRSHTAIDNNNTDASEHHAISWYCFLLWVALAGSFVQMQFTFPYQEAVPIFLLGLYLGLITRYSEAFIPTLKVVTIALPKKAYWSVRGLLILAVCFVFAIYTNWISHNLAISHMVTTPISSETKIPTPAIHPNHYQFELRFLVSLYQSAGNYTAVNTIEEHALNYWPNNYRALKNKLEALINIQAYDQAWALIKKIDSAHYEGDYFTTFAALKIYQETNQRQNFINTFVTLMNIDEALLSRNEATYRNLFRYSLTQPELLQFSQYYYDKSIQYHDYDCHTENNMAAYHWGQQNFANAVRHINAIKNSLDNSCLNPLWDDAIKQFQLAIIIDESK